MDDIGNSAVGDGLFKAFTSHTLFETDVEFGSRCGIGDKPHFGFGFTIELFGEVCRGMNLNGEIVGRVEDFDEEGKTGIFSEIDSENFFAMVLPEIV